MALPDELTAATRAVMMKYITDNITELTPTFDFFLKKFEYIGDGRPPEWPIEYQQIVTDNPQAFDAIGVGHYQTVTSLQPTAYAHYHAPITVSKEERMQITGGKNSIDRIATWKGKSAMKALMMAINADCLTGVATTSSDRKLCGMSNAIANSAYWNIAATDNWFDPATLDTTTTLSDDIVGALVTAKTTVKNLKGNLDVAITTGAIWNAFHNALQGRERVEVGTKGVDTYRTGAENLYVRGIRIWHDPDATAAHLYTFDSDDWQFVGISESGEFWDDRGFDAPVNSHVWTAHRDCYPLLVCTNRRHAVKFTGLS